MNKYRKLRKANEENEKKLNLANQKIYTKMVIYLKGSRLTIDQQEEVRSDLILLFKDAEENQQPLLANYADDYQKFCDEIIAVYPEKTKKKIFSEYAAIFLENLANLMIISVVFQIVENLINQQPINIYLIKQYQGPVALFIILTSVYVVEAYCRCSFKQFGLIKQVFISFLYVLYVGLIILGMSFFDQTIAQTTIYLVIVVILITYCLAYLIKKYIN